MVANERLRPEVRGRSAARIVVAEDDTMLGDLIETKLTRAGYRVTRARDGKAAWAALLDERPDLVVLDWMMPEMTGLELLGLIRDHPALCEMPVVMLTAVNLKSDLATAVHVGATDYVLKPFRPNELLARVRRQLALGPRPHTAPPVLWAPEAPA